MYCPFDTEKAINQHMASHKNLKEKMVLSEMDMVEDNSNSNPAYVIGDRNQFISVHIFYFFIISYYIIMSIYLLFLPFPIGFT